MEGTIDPKKVADAVSNTLAGTPEEVRDLIEEKYHRDDRLMMWFDFNNHDNDNVKKSMRLFSEKIARDLYG
jgi:alkanesulfonate monooxygenase SsuD/methylene tetrahydromethanopterin reductase-like flavin-dependent oxidoreductase (luciferase family)